MTFSGLTNLSGLYLRDNQLSSIESGTFSGLTYLTELYLRDNQISSIEPGTFSDLTNLEQLELDGNQLPSIESGDLQRTDESDDAGSGRQPDIEHRIGRLSAD